MGKIKNSFIQKHPESWQLPDFTLLQKDLHLSTAEL
jgi:hypothetical protein